MLVRRWATSMGDGELADGVHSLPRDRLKADQAQIVELLDPAGRPGLRHKLTSPRCYG